MPSPWFLVFASTLASVFALAIYVGMGRRVALARRATLELQARDVRWHHIAEHVGDLVWVHDVDGTCTYVSPSCLGHLGYEPKDLVGAPRTIHPEEQAAVLAAIEALVARSSERNVELRHRILTKNGEWRWFSSRMNVSVDASGKPIDIHSVSREDGTRQAAEGVMLLAKNDAETATRAKSDFLARMSHEIRTPMNAVLGMTELALQTELTGEQREYITTAHSAAASLLGIIDDVLDFSKVEAGKLRLEAVRFELRPAIGQTLRALTLRAQAKGVALAVRIDDHVPDSVVGDSHRLAQILVNLVANAINFTDRGEIVVRVSASEPTPSRAKLRVSVSDSGIGIADDKLLLIFDAFTQAEESTTRSFGGTGLGLAICKQLVTMMGGEITVKSTLGRGSVFDFSIDVADPHHGAPPSVKPVTPVLPRIAGTAPRKVLLAEDNAVNQKVARAILEWAGHTVVSVVNGKLALAALAQDTFDVVLMDVQMPEMDGLETTRNIRAMELTRGGHLPIVALTAQAMPGDEAVCLAGGMDAYIRKPLTSRLLLQAIEAVTQKTVSPAQL